MFREAPRVCMGLNKNHTKVIHATAADEENRYKALAKLDEKDTASQVEVVEATDKICKR